MDICYKNRYNNVDINVAVNTPDGLFTPIVPDADKKGLLAISNNVKELATKAKERKLVPADYDVPNKPPQQPTTTTAQPQSPTPQQRTPITWLSS